MLERRDAITNEVLEPITFDLAYHTVLPRNVSLSVFVLWLLHPEYKSATFLLHVERRAEETCSLKAGEFVDHLSVPKLLKTGFYLISSSIVKKKMFRNVGTETFLCSF